MTQATARRELRADLAKGMCGFCAAPLSSKTRIVVADHKHGCKGVQDAGLKRRPKTRGGVR